MKQPLAMGKRINRHLMKKQEEEIRSSKANQPKYFKWLWANHKSTVILALAGIAGCIFATPVILDPANDNPIAIIILALVAVYGFTVGMALQPYTIYRNLVKMNYWSDGYGK